MKYRIKLKRDWPGGYGFWDPETRSLKKLGFVVSDGCCNVMPGAVWFKSIAEAMNAIVILEESKATGINFWKLYYK